MTAPPGPQREAASRRRFLAAAGTAAAVPAAAALIGVGPLADAARAATSDGLPDYAPIPPGALGPALNADGYFVGNINGNLYWVTDSVYQAMFLTTRDGVVLVDAPPTIGHNLLRAIGAVTQANGRPANVTHLVYSHSDADHAGASSLLDDDVVRTGAALCRCTRSARQPFCDAACDAPGPSSLPGRPEEHKP
jgi:glyoxylase-like metal-dependent hydrolase (beta-lactamase superfamily II)